jgi:exopolysaccharide biosynthesis polyprenyl glycosylphosphotransferase
MLVSTSGFASKKKYILLSVDIAIIVVSSVLACVMRFTFLKGIDYIADYFFSFLVTGLVYLATFYIFDLYQFTEDFRSSHFFFKVTQAVLVASIVNALLYYGTWSLKLHRGIFALNTLFIFALILIWRYSFSALLSGELFRHKTVIVGSSAQVQAIVDVINLNPGSGLDIEGLVIPLPADRPDNIPRIKELGDKIDADQLERMKVDTLLVDNSVRDTKDLIRALIGCSHRGIRIVDIATLYEKLTSKIPFDFIDDQWLLLSLMSRNKVFHDRLKRGVDLLFSALLLLLLSPIMALAAVAILLETGRPIFHVQERIGPGGKRIRVFKFRSMFQSEEPATSAEMTSEKDKRITPVGKIIRRWRVDETPQLLNVLFGEMSLVGPRPEREAFVKEFDEKIPFFSERLTIRPGITGWAQVKYGYAATLAEMKEKLMYDLYYIKNRSLWLDLLILLLTVKVVLIGKGK